MKVLAQRIGEGPIIRPHMDERMGDNINGPSLIKVPDWGENLTQSAAWPSRILEERIGVRSQTHQYESIVG